MRTVYRPDEFTDSEDEVPIFSRSKLCEITKMTSNTEIQTILENVFNQVSEDDSNHPQSGLTFQRVNTIELYVSKFRIIKGSSYIDLPAKLQGLRCVLNPNNADNQCFKWAVLIALFNQKVKCSKEKADNYKKFEVLLNCSMLRYPMDPTDNKTITMFEEVNKLNVNIFCIETDRIITIYLYHCTYSNKARV